MTTEPRLFVSELCDEIVVQGNQHSGRKLHDWVLKELSTDRRSAFKFELDWNVYKLQKEKRDNILNEKVNL